MNYSQGYSMNIPNTFDFINEMKKKLYASHQYGSQIILRVDFITYLICIIPRMRLTCISWGPLSQTDFGIGELIEGRHLDHIALYSSARSTWTFGFDFFHCCRDITCKLVSR